MHTLLIHEENICHIKASPKPEPVASEQHLKIKTKKSTLQLLSLCSFASLSSPAFSKHTKVGGQEYNLFVVDTAGQDEYSVIPQSYFININGYVLVYSVNSQKR